MGDAVMIAGGVVVAVGATVGLLAVFRDRARGRRRCPKCWYAGGDVAPLRCPECGYEATRERDLYRTRRHWRWALTGLLVVLAGGALLVTPKVRRDGIWSIMPDTRSYESSSRFTTPVRQIHHGVASAVERSESVMRRHLQPDATGCDAHARRGGLDDPSRSARFAATRSLYGLRDPSPAIVTRLIELAQDDVVFDTAVGTLGSYGPAAIEALPVLEMRAHEQATGDRRAALTAIGAVGAGREDVLETLLAALDAEDPETQRGAAMGLVHFPDAADRIVEPLLALLEGEPSITQSQVLETLASYGDAAEPALPRIRELAKGASGLEINAMFAWWRIGGEAAPVLPGIIEVVEDWKYGGQATQLLSTLVEMGAAARPALRALRASLRHEPKPAYRESILVTIEAIEGY